MSADPNKKPEKRQCSMRNPRQFKCQFRRFAAPPGRYRRVCIPEAPQGCESQRGARDPRRFAPGSWVRSANRPYPLFTIGAAAPPARRHRLKSLKPLFGIAGCALFTGSATIRL